MWLGVGLFFVGGWDNVDGRRGKK